MCYTSHEWVTILQQQGTPWLSMIATAAYYLVPDLSLLDIKTTVVYQLPLDLFAVLTSSLYVITFSSIFVYGAIVVFQKKVLS